MGRRHLLKFLIPLSFAFQPLAPALADGPRWQEIPPPLQGILGPLEQDWASMDGERRRKWLAIAGQYEGMTPREQQNLLSRMRSWAKLSPDERRTARERYREWLSIPPEQRETLRDKWETYQNLPPEEKARIRSSGSN